MKSPFRCLSAGTLFLFGMNLSVAQQQRPPAPDKSAEKPKEEKKPPAPEEKIVQTKHSLKIGGQEKKYTATAGQILLKLDAGAHNASIFYVLENNYGAARHRHRPRTFHINAGARPRPV